MSASSRRGIPTKIDGITYRSQTEGRWAVLLNELFPRRVQWEPLDATGYIPDFVVLGDRPLLIEVKSDYTLGELAAHIDRLDIALVGHWQHDVMIVGGIPFLDDIAHDVCGLMRQTYEDGTHSWERAIWMRCALCRCSGWYHEMGEWVCHPCGHYDGDHYIEAVDRDRITRYWADACETARWTPA